MSLFAVKKTEAQRGTIISSNILSQIMAETEPQPRSVDFQCVFYAELCQRINSVGLAPWTGFEE